VDNTAALVTIIKPIKLNKMDKNEALDKWEQMGHTWVDWDAPEAYYILFVKDGEVVGNIKTVAGGISWKYPDDLVIMYKIGLQKL
jgi:hypothetical protein